MCLQLVIQWQEGGESAKILRGKSAFLKSIICTVIVLKNETIFISPEEQKTQKIVSSYGYRNKQKI